MLLTLAVLALPVSGSVYAQQAAVDPNIVVTAATTTPGPEIKGVITARNGSKMKVTAADGTSTIIAITDAT